MRLQLSSADGCCQARPDRALPLYRKARFIYEQGLGPSDPRVSAILSQEGLILMAEGKLALAEQPDGVAALYGLPHPIPAAFPLAPLKLEVVPVEPVVLAEPLPAAFPASA